MLLSKTFRKAAAGLATLSLASAAVPAAALAQTSGPVNPQTAVTAQVIKKYEKEFSKGYKVLTRNVNHILKNPDSSQTYFPGLAENPLSLTNGPAIYSAGVGDIVFGAPQPITYSWSDVVVCKNLSHTSTPDVQCHIASAGVETQVPYTQQNITSAFSSTNTADFSKAYAEMSRLEQKIARSPNSLGTYFPGKSGKPKAGTININSGVAGTGYSINAEATCKNVSGTKNVQCYLSGMNLNS